MGVCLTYPLAILKTQFRTLWSFLYVGWGSVGEPDRSSIVENRSDQQFLVGNNLIPSEAAQPPKDIDPKAGFSYGGEEEGSLVWGGRGAPSLVWLLHKGWRWDGSSCHRLPVWRV